MCSADSGAGSARCGSVSKAPCVKQGTQCCCFSCVAAFPGHVLHCRPSGQPKCLRVPTAGDVGNAWALSVGAGQHVDLWVGSFLPCSTASSPVYLHHLTNGSPPWVLDGVSRPNCRGKLLVWPSAHLGTSPCLSDPRGYEPGRQLSSREGGWTPALDLTSWTSICIFRCRSQPVGCLRPPHSLFKGPERSGRTCRHCLCGIQWPPDACPQALRSLCPWSQGEWDREVPVAWVGGCLLKTEGCSGWGRLWGICSAGGVAGCSVYGSPTEEHLGSPRGVAPILERTRLPSLLSIFALFLGLFLQVRGASAAF